MRRNALSLPNMKWIAIALVVLVGVAAGVYFVGPSLWTQDESGRSESTPTEAEPPSDEGAATSETAEGPAIECGPALYAHDFSNPDGNWYEGSNDNSEWAYTEDAAYRISTSVASNVVPSWAPIDSTQLPEGFCVRVRVREPSVDAEGGGPAMAVGLAFGGNAEQSRFHTFDVAPASSAYRVRERDFSEGASTNLVEWTPTEAIGGPDEWTEIEIRVRGDRAQFYVDGRRVHGADVDGSGRVGLFLESFDEANASGTFDDFEIRAVASDGDGS